jgi:hypothetical protein
MVESILENYGLESATFIEFREAFEKLSERDKAFYDKLGDEDKALIQWTYLDTSNMSVKRLGSVSAVELALKVCKFVLERRAVRLLKLVPSEKRGEAKKFIESETGIKLDLTNV